MKLIPRLDRDVVRGYSFFCPACGELHSYNVSGVPPLWNFNGDLAAPSFSPSLRYLTGSQCHLYVTKGQIVYCSDCLHGYAGKSVEMIELDEKGRPIVSDKEPEAKPAEAKEKEKPKAKPARTHREECGEVGETGEHGDLGSNAAKREKEK